MFCVPNVASFSGFILIVPSVSSNVYLPMIKLHTIYDFHELLINWINLHLHKTNVILNTFTYKIESVNKTSGHAYNTYIYCIHLSHNITIYNTYIYCIHLSHNITIYNTYIYCIHLSHNITIYNTYIYCIHIPHNITIIQHLHILYTYITQYHYNTTLTYIVYIYYTISL